MSNPLLEQLPVLIGVCVGAVATYATTSLAERSRWRRERSVRWDDARMRAYTGYGDAVKKMSHIASRIAAGRGFPHSVEPLVPNAEVLGSLADANSARARAWESVLLLGDPHTIAAARAWHLAVWRLVGFARGQLSAMEEWEASVKETKVARDSFYDCARRDLGISGEAVPTPVLPPNWIEGVAASDDSSEIEAGRDRMRL